MSTTPVRIEAQRAVITGYGAITPIGNDLFVWLAVEGKAKRVKVQTGLREDGLVELIGAVHAGDQVVIASKTRSVPSLT
ncbi:MAG: hypothetical protein EBW11_12675 [Betaproteobacteria bacterium]|nr:hypothetical protein [Betaproteobacteria bacterium]